jgi:hypothetical protein
MSYLMTKLIRGHSSIPSVGRHGGEELRGSCSPALLSSLGKKMEPAHPSSIVDPSSQMVVQVTTQVMALFLKACL